MKALKSFGFLGGSNSSAETPPEDGRVVELFRSRAELRKQHEELGAEMQRLRDRLKLQEAATSRVQEMYESLEKRLEAADTGLSTLVFYHLRALWSDGRLIIELLVQDLAGKQEGIRDASRDTDTSVLRAIAGDRSFAVRHRVQPFGDAGGCLRPQSWRGMGTVR